MEIRMCSIASGSSGNCIYVGTEEEGFIIDSGVSAKMVLEGLKNIGVSTADIKGIFVTHEHSDHVKGLGPLARKLGAPIYANEATWSAMEICLGKIKPEQVKYINSGEEIGIGGVGIGAYTISHDAVSPMGYYFTKGGKKVAVATDLGFVSQLVEDSILGAEVVLLESNHDVEMLMVGSYPFFLKKRILSEVGHLSNETAGEFACRLFEKGTRKILLGHLSRENNFPELAYETVKAGLFKQGIEAGRHVELQVAPRCDISKVFYI